MAITITSDFGVYHNCDTKQPTATSTVTTFVKEGLRCNGLRVSNTISNIVQSPDKYVNLHNKYIYIQIRVASKIDTLNNGGIRVCARDTNGNIAEWFVGGSENYNGEWRCFVVPANRPSDIVSANPYNPSLTRNIGVRFWVKEASSSVNCFQDYVCYGRSLIVSGNYKTYDYVNFDTIAQTCRQLNIGIIEKRDDCILCFGDITFQNVTLLDKKRVIKYPTIKNIDTYTIYIKNSDVNIYTSTISGTNNYILFSIDQSSNCTFENCAFVNCLLEYKSLQNTAEFIRSQVVNSNMQYNITNFDKSILISCSPNLIDLNHNNNTITNTKIMHSETHGIILYTNEGGTADITFNNVQFFDNSTDILIFNDSTPYQQLDLKIFLTNGSKINTITKTQPMDTVHIIDENQDENLIVINRITIPSSISILDSSMNEVYYVNDFTGIFTQEYNDYLNENIQINIYSTNAQNNLIEMNLYGGTINIFINQEKDFVYYNP